MYFLFYSNLLFLEQITISLMTDSTCRVPLVWRDRAGPQHPVLGLHLDRAGGQVQGLRQLRQVRHLHSLGVFRLRLLHPGFYIYPAWH